MRQQKIPQYFCNIKVFGLISFASTVEELQKDEIDRTFQKILRDASTDKPLHEQYEKID